MLRAGFDGKMVETPGLRVGFVGCGGHALRNLLPTLAWVPAELVAICDLDLAKAQAAATRHGFARAYDSLDAMLAAERLDAVFLCAGYDRAGRPLYPVLAAQALQAGCHVWMEKPPAATCRELEDLRRLAQRQQRHVMVGLKKMFVPANEKAAELMCDPDFGTPSLVTLQYPQCLPEPEAFLRYFAGERQMDVIGFLDHLCHPVSLMIFLLGMPAAMSYARSASGAGAALFRFPGGATASLALTSGAAVNGGMERTQIISDRGRHITVENNLRVTYHRLPPLAYGSEPRFFAGGLNEASVSWEPEFSLGQLYNKGTFLLGYFGEIDAFVRGALAGTPPAKAHLQHAWQVTRIFESFAAGAERWIEIDGSMP